MDKSLQSLSLDEKIKLVEELWESIETERSAYLSPLQQQMLEKRLKQRQETPGKGKPWKEIRKKYFTQQTINTKSHP